VYNLRVFSGLREFKSPSPHQAFRIKPPRRPAAGTGIRERGTPMRSPTALASHPGAWTERRFQEFIYPASPSGMNRVLVAEVVSQDFPTRWGDDAKCSGSREGMTHSQERQSWYGSSVASIDHRASEIPRIAALYRIGSAAVRAVIDLHHAISPYGNINEVGDLVIPSKRKAGQIFSEFRHRRLQNDAGSTAPRIPQMGPIRSAEEDVQSAETTRRGFTSLGRRKDELSFYMDWSRYPTGYTTSAEYPSIRAHSRAGPAVE